MPTTDEEERLANAVRLLREELETVRASLTGGREALPLALEQLSQSESRYRTLVAALSEGVVLQAADGSILTCNGSAERILGLSIDQMMGRTSLDPRWRSIRPDGSPFEGSSHPIMVALRTGERQHDVPMGVHKPDGTLTWISINAEPLRRAPGEPPYAAVASFTDVTELREAQRALEKKTELLSLALAAAHAGCWEWDLATRELRWSEGIEAILGVDVETLGTSWEQYSALVHPNDRERLSRALERASVSEEGSFELEHRIVAEGVTRWLFGAGAVVRDPSGRAARMIGAVIDTTATKELEARLLQAEKMQSIGRLAGGVAHDFNNLLTTILLSVELARRGDRAFDQRLLDDIRRAAEQGSRLTKQLLGFARKQMFDLEPMRVGDLVERTHDLLDRLLGDRIALRTTCMDTGAVRADASRLEQVILNLAVNARDAMPKGGTLTISTKDVDVDEAEAARTPGARPGPHVALAVEDTGTGIPADVLDHVFEPFFTTKEHGSGLGLATCYGIVTQLGGHLRVESAQGHGTKMLVLLPKTDDAGLRIEEARPAAIRSGRERILVVEDEELVRRVAVRALERFGYDVLQANDGGEALALAKNERGAIDLLLTDLSMPGLTGLELAEQLRALRPEMRVLLASGYAEETASPEDLRYAFIQKPYTVSLLAQRVREALDGAAAPRK